MILSKARSMLHGMINREPPVLFPSVDGKETPETTSSNSSSPPACVSEGLSVGTVLCEAPLDSDDDNSEDEDSEEFRRPVTPSLLC